MPPTRRRWRSSISCSARSGCRSSGRRSCRRRSGCRSRPDGRAGSTPPTPSARRSAALARRACGRGVSGAIAWRSLLTRFRTPRTALETFTGAGVGLAAVLVPTLTRDTVGSGAVLVGGAVQLAVLFMSGNSFGSRRAAGHARVARRRRPVRPDRRQGAQHRHRRLTAGGDRPVAGGDDHGRVAVLRRRARRRRRCVARRARGRPSCSRRWCRSRSRSRTTRSRAASRARA